MSIYRDINKHMRLCMNMCVREKGYNSSVNKTTMCHYFQSMGHQLICQPTTYLAYFIQTSIGKHIINQTGAFNLNQYPLI
jgi:hypothetical protein